MPFLARIFKRILNEVEVFKKWVLMFSHWRQNNKLVLSSKEGSQEKKGIAS